MTMARSSSADQAIHDALAHRPEDTPEVTRLRNELEAALLVCQQQAERIAELQHDRDLAVSGIRGTIRRCQIPRERGHDA